MQEAEQVTSEQPARAVVINDINAIRNGSGPVGWNPTAGDFTSDLPALSEAERPGPYVDAETPIANNVNRGQQGQDTARPIAVQALPVNVNHTAGQNGAMVESRDRANPGVVIHRTFIAK